MGNGVNDELIRKKDALDALMAERKHLLANGQKGAEHILTHHGYNVIDELDVPKINVGDMIYRQAAIDALDCINGVEEVLRSLPSAEPTITHEQAIDYLHKTGWLQNHDRILTESKMMMPVQPIIYCEKCLYKKICSWKNQGAKFCSFGERGDTE